MFEPFFGAPDHVTDDELTEGLHLLKDPQLARAQAHLAAGLPMRVAYGWDEPDEPACFGCLVGVSMSQVDFISAGNSMLDISFRIGTLSKLALFTFPIWVKDNEEVFGIKNHLNDPISRPTLNRLAVLLDQEYRRRHPLAEAEAGETVIERVAVGAVA